MTCTKYPLNLCLFHDGTLSRLPRPEEEELDDAGVCGPVRAQLAVDASAAGRAADALVAFPDHAGEDAAHFRKTTNVIGEMCVYRKYM